LHAPANGVAVRKDHGHRENKAETIEVVSRAIERALHSFEFT